MTGNIISHYKIIEKLGEGGMGELYRAEDVTLKRTVALKFLPQSISFDEEAKKRFLTEAQSASSLDHPNICTIYESGITEDSRPFISMALYEGETLKEKISKGKIGLDEAINIAVQICEGLDKAHQKNIIHRDIKPANIFITTDGIIKILDFGLAKVKGQSQLTQAGTTVGTIAYMSPEQATGSEVDQRTDIWSLGAVIFEMVSGNQPFTADYDQAVIYSILNEQPDFSKTPEELIPVLQKALTKSPDGRYGNIKEMSIELESLKNGTTPVSRNSYIKPAGIKFKKKLLALVLFFFAIASVLYFYLNTAGADRILKPEKKMIVVLPFENLGSPEDDYFAQGMREEISNKLAALGSIGVISRSSAEQLANSGKSTKEIGRELGVDYILEGTVQWAKNKNKLSRIRVIPQLISVNDDINIWSDSYDRVIDDIFNVQNEIAQKVVNKLGIKILPQNFASGPPPTKNLEAYDYYLKAERFQMVNSTNSDLLTCTKLYEKAIELDTNFAEAYALSSIAYLVIYGYVNNDEINLEKAKKYLQKAKGLKPGMVQVHLANAFFSDWKGEHQEQLNELKKALAFQPNNAEATHQIGWIYANMGIFDLGFEYMLKSISLDPLVARYAYDVAAFYSLSRNYKNADKYFRRAVELGPNVAWYYTGLASNYIDWKGDIKLARQSMKVIKNEEFEQLYFENFIDLDIMERKFDKVLHELKTSKIKYGGPVTTYHLIAQLYGYKKDYKSSAAYFDTARTQIEKLLRSQPDNDYLHSILSISYAGLGNKTKAISEMNQSINLGKPEYDFVYKMNTAHRWLKLFLLLGDYKNAFKQIDYLLSTPSDLSINRLKLNPLYDPLRNLPEYKKVIAKYSNKSEG